MTVHNRFFNLAFQLTEEQMEALNKSFSAKRGMGAVQAIDSCPNKANTEYQCIENILTDYGLNTTQLKPEALANFASFTVDANL